MNRVVRWLCQLLFIWRIWLTWLQDSWIPVRRAPRAAPPLPNPRGGIRLVKLAGIGLVACFMATTGWVTHEHLQLAAFSALLSRRKIIAAPEEDEPPTPAITLSLSEPGATILLVQGGEVSRVVTIERTNFTGDVTLSALSLPTGVTAEFTPAVVSGSSSTSVMKLIGAGDAPVVVDDTIQVKGTGTGISDATVDALLTVTDLAEFSHLMTNANLAKDSSGVPLTRSDITGRISGDVCAPEMPTQTGTVWEVTTEAQLIAAFNGCVGGDTIRVMNDIIITQEIGLPHIVSEGYVVWEGDTWGDLEYVYGTGGPVSESDRALMPKIRYRWGAAVFNARTHACKRMVVRGLMFTAETSTTSCDWMLSFRNTANPSDPDLFCSDIVLAGCGFVGASGGSVRKAAVQMNGLRMRVTGCWFDELLYNGENKCILTGEGKGPYQYDRNYFACIGICLLLGGAGMAGGDHAENDVADMFVYRNHFHKPSRWNPHHPDYDSVTYGWTGTSSKNLIELKTGIRITITENVFEGAYRAAQGGWAVLVKQDGNDQLGRGLKDVLVYLNYNVNCNRQYGASFDANQTTTGCERIHFIGNLAVGCNRSEESGTELMNPLLCKIPAADHPDAILYGYTFTDIRFQWMTIVGPRVPLLSTIEISDGPSPRVKLDGFRFTDVITICRSHTTATAGFGLIGSGGWGGHGNPSISAMAINYVVERILAVGATINLSNYPTPATMYNEPVRANVGWENYDTDMRLAASSLYYDKGLGGRPLGAPVELILDAVDGVRQTV